MLNLSVLLKNNGESKDDSKSTPPSNAAPDSTQKTTSPLSNSPFEQALQTKEVKQESETSKIPTQEEYDAGIAKMLSSPLSDVPMVRMCQQAGMTLTDLFIKHQNDLRPKIDALDETKEEDREKIIQWLTDIESIFMQAKAAYGMLDTKLRKSNQKLGKARYDKAAGSLNPLNGSLASLTDPAEQDRQKSAARKLKIKLNQLESTIAGFLKLGQTDNEIIDMLSGGKRSLGEITQALRNAKKYLSEDDE